MTKPSLIATSVGCVCLVLGLDTLLGSSTYYMPVKDDCLLTQPDINKQPIFELTSNCTPNLEHSKAFNSIYNAGSWSVPLSNIQFYYTYGLQDPKERRSSSGPGSNVGCMSSPGLQFLTDIIREHNISS